jgi:hypothetical protein
MCKLSFWLAASVAIHPTATLAQVTSPPSIDTVPKVATNYKGLNTDDIKFYCIYNDKLYSPGASFCVYKNVMIVCSQDGNARAKWADLVPEPFCDPNPSETPK